LAEAHFNLGLCLGTQGNFVEALQSLKKGHELGSRRPGWADSSGQLVKTAEQLVALDARLQEVSNGQAKPRDGVEAVALARFCQNFKKRYTSAVRFYTDAFAAEPKLAGDLGSAYRYSAARAAAVAGVGQGQDAHDLDEKERARLRELALGWLRADLEAWGRLLETGPEPARPAARVATVLQHWLADPDFAGVRDPEALARLPERERQAWQQLWGDVRDRLARARGPATPKKEPPTR
jgi:serine/threonine-protein kinase